MMSGHHHHHHHLLLKLRKHNDADLARSNGSAELHRKALCFMEAAVGSIAVTAKR